MQFLNVKVITQADTSPPGRESREIDDALGVTIFKGALMVERFQAETEIYDLADTIHVSVNRGEFRKVTRG